MEVVDDDQEETTAATCTDLVGSWAGVVVLPDTDRVLRFDLTMELDEDGSGEAHAVRRGAVDDELFDVTWTADTGCSLLIEGTYKRQSTGEHGSNVSSYDWTFYGVFDRANRVEGDAERFWSTSDAEDDSSWRLEGTFEMDREAE